MSTLTIDLFEELRQLNFVKKEENNAIWTNPDEYGNHWYFRKESDHYYVEEEWSDWDGENYSHGVYK